MKRNSNKVRDFLYEKQAAVCKAFAHPTRIHILDLLGTRERSVSELKEELGVSKANLSQHISLLRSVGAVVARREGKQLYCALAMPEVKQACTLIREVLREQFREAKHLLA